VPILVLQSFVLKQGLELEQLGQYHVARHRQ
jgi:hypothetical protein